MSPGLSEAAPASVFSEGEELREDSAHYIPKQPPQTEKPAQVIVKLFQCRICSSPYYQAVTLPCGRTICRTCLPETHTRQNITYPANDERRQGFQCPFDECNKEHALGDCNVDVLFNKAVQIMRSGIQKAAEEALEKNISTSLSVRDPWQVAGISSLREDVSFQQLSGGRLVSTWSLAEKGGLLVDSEVIYADDATFEDDAELATEIQRLELTQETIRSEVDCQVCYALLYDPLTTGCGHTFCRSCLHRILDHSDCCPICRAKLGMNPLLNRTICPSNAALTQMIEHFWYPELLGRKEMLDVDRSGGAGEYELPLFVCALSFPCMPTLLHVFEPRYRLMVRRCLEGNRMFGIVLPRRPRHAGDAHFHELGTLLRIVNVEYYPDGRSLIETAGLSRFRVLNHGSVDGYAMANIERIDDISLQDEEAVEAREVLHEASDGAPSDGAASGTEGRQSPTQIPAQLSDVDTMSTQHLMEFASAFVNRMRRQSVPWLAECMLEIYGEPPSDPAVFPWWFASILPLKDTEKYRLLGTGSVRDRLKICCSWIVEWQTSRWVQLIDGLAGLFTTASSSEND